MTEPEVLKLKEAAKLMRVCPKTLVTWAKEGKVSAEKIGHDWRFRRSKLLEMLNGRSAA